MSGFGMGFGEHEIRSVTETVWSTMLGLDVRHDPDWLVADEGAGWTTAFVLIDGSWCGTIVLCCPSTLAERVARCIFTQDNDVSNAGQIADALGELVNQTGGTLKRLLSEPCTLSLPTVLHGADGEARPRAAHPSRGVCLRGRDVHRVRIAAQHRTLAVVARVLRSRGVLRDPPTS